MIPRESFVRRRPNLVQRCFEWLQHSRIPRREKPCKSVTCPFLPRLLCFIKLRTKADVCGDKFDDVHDRVRMLGLLWTETSMMSVEGVNESL